MYKSATFLSLLYTAEKLPTEQNSVYVSLHLKRITAIHLSLSDITLSVNHPISVVIATVFILITVGYMSF